MIIMYLTAIMQQMTQIATKFLRENSLEFLHFKIFSHFYVSKNILQNIALIEKFFYVLFFIKKKNIAGINI